LDIATDRAHYGSRILATDLADLLAAAGIGMLGDRAGVNDGHVGEGAMFDDRIPAGAESLGDESGLRLIETAAECVERHSARIR
jgi:hypothetical protein